MSGPWAIKSLRISCLAIALSWVLFATPTLAQFGGGRGRGGGGGGFRFDPAQIEQFRRMREQMQQGGTPGEAPKPGEGQKPDEAAKPGEAKPDAGPPSVRRPMNPSQPADDRELDAWPDDNGKISFSFKGQPWPAVLEWLADVSDMSLQWEEAPAGYLDLTTRGKYTVDEVRDMLNSVLLAKGFTLLRSGEVLIVANLTKLDVSLVPRVTAKELDKRGSHEPVKVFFDLDWLVAESAAEEVKPLLSTFGKATALKATNRLDVLDTAGNLRRIRDLLEEEQSDTGQKHLVREFKLRYSRANEVLGTLNTLLGLEQNKSDLPTDPRQAMMALQMQQMQQFGRRGGGGGGEGAPEAPPAPSRKEASVFLAVNTRENSILANAPPDKMAVIEQAITAIDVRPSRDSSLIGGVTRMQVYRLAGISPEVLVNVLKELGGLDPTTRLEVDEKKNALIAYGPLVDHVIIRALVDKLDGAARQFEVIQLRTLSAEYVAGSILSLMQGPEKPAAEPSRSSRWSFFDSSSQQTQPEGGADRFWVEADLERNRLLLRANDVELTEVRALLTKLGEIPSGERNMSTMRILPGAPGDDMQRVLDRLERVWPTVSPNPLEIDADNADDAAEARPRPRRKPAATPSVTPSARRRSEPDRQTKAGAPRAAGKRYHLAQDRKAVTDEDAEEESATPDEEPSVAETPDDAISDDAVPSDDPADDAADDLPADAPSRDAEVNEDADDEDADSRDDDPEPADDLEEWEDESEFMPADEDADDDEFSEDSDGDRRPEAPAPVKITVGPQGIVISSNDTEALDRLEELLANAMPARPNHRIFSLKHTYASDVALLLKDIFKDDSTSNETSSRADTLSMLFGGYRGGGSSAPTPSRATLGKRRPLAFIDDPVTNTILVQGADAGQLGEIKELIEFYDREETPNSESVRQTQWVELRYANAKESAEVIKDVFRDLLSPNDRALQSGMPQGPQRGQDQGFYSSMTSFLSSDSGQSSSTPRFKGMLSVGVDERANGLLVSAPKNLLSEVLERIHELDEAARPLRPVAKFHRLSKPGHAAIIRNALAPPPSVSAPPSPEPPAYGGQSTPPGGGFGSPSAGGGQQPRSRARGR